MWVRFLSRAVAACLLLVSAAGLFGRHGWPFEIVTSLYPQVGLIALLSCLLFWALKQPLSLWIGGLASLIALIASAAQFMPGPPPIDDPDLRIVWANTYKKPDALKATLDLAEREQADVVLVAEVLGTDMQEVDSYLYRAGPQRGYQSEVWIMSARPIAYVGHLPTPYISGPVASIETANGTVLIAGMHLKTPATPPLTKMRNADIAAAFESYGALDRAIMVGDFNTVPWSSAFRDTQERTGLAHIPYGPWSSWVSALPFLGLPIDHAFVTGDLEAHVRVGPDTGSDHRPLIVDVKIRD